MIAKGRLPDCGMNQTEARYAADLALRRRAGEVAWFKFEAIKLRLADLTFYTPDFFVMLPDGTLEVHEVKGGFIRDDAMVKLKIAAEQFPFRFILAQYRNKATGWTFREI
jgi:hypothetical protein